jgi:two-component system sensor histidine kinase UhpB
MMSSIRRRLWASFWKNRTISWRLSALALVPLMSVALGQVGVMLRSTPFEISQDLREHGEIVAAAIAENSEYGLTSGNLTDLKRIAHGFIQADKWIYAVEVYDVDGKLRIQDRVKDKRVADGGHFEARVFRHTLPVDDFANDESLHDTSAADSGVETSEMIGTVRVWLWQGPARDKQAKKQRSQYVLLFGVALLSIWAAIVLGKALHRPMEIAIQTLRQIRDGDLRVHLTFDDGGEMGELLDAINNMSGSLAEAKHDLEEKVQVRTRDLEQSMLQLRKADAEKRRLIQKVDSAVEDERKSIAIEIHDELNAVLLGARYSSRRILDMAARLPEGVESTVITESAESIINVTSSLYTSARKIVRRLRPEVLDMLGLEGAVEEMLQTYESAPGAPAFTFKHSGDIQQVSGPLAIAAYRLIQECVSNVIKHAQASDVLVVVQVRSSDIEHGLLLAVIDNGAGFDPERVQEGIGLIGMKERVFAFSGEFKISTEPGAGTRVEITLPLTGTTQPST